ncbi:MAG TPA: hypothetical protein VFK06_23405 [Candidatus Angelobacter sp.]|nr:hypothetical protein [Candidatus Angelobacter sp.]
MSIKLNRRIAAELDLLVSQEILTTQQRQNIGERYPTAPWDILVLARWFTILGAVTAGTGTVVFAKEYVNALRLGEFGLALATAGFIFLGRYAAQKRALVKTGAALEMAGGFALQGLTFLLAIDFSSGSKNWPALIGTQTVLLAALAYLLKNRLVLTHAAVCFFIFFGGETGYLSGWGAYWMDMTYPVRYLAAGFVFLVIAWLHATQMKDEYQGFSRVYGHLGLLIINLALWFLALFGYFEQATWSNNSGERIAFSALWALVSVLSLWLAGTLGQRILRSYGMTFLVINVYTFYFQFVAYHSPEAWFLHLLLIGGSLVWLGFTLERYWRQNADLPSTAPTP